MGQIVRLAANLVMARFLMPEAFGIMAVISTLMMALNLVSDIGTGAVIIQSPRGADRSFLDTAWTLQVIRGFGLWGFGVLLALGIGFGSARGWFTAGTVYADPRLPLMIAVATFGLAIVGLGSINFKLAERNLDLRANTFVELGGGLVTALVMVTGAVLTGSVWALVAGGLVGASIKCLLSYLLVKGPRPAFRLEPAALRELLSKGKWVLVATLLGFAATNLDRMLLGGLTDGTRLGLYSIALGLSTIGSSIPAMMLMRVAYPAISEVVRERMNDLERTYRRLQQLTDLCVGTMAGALYVASGPVIELLYDERYRAAGPMLGLLAIGTVGARLFVVELVYTAMARNSLVAASMVPRVLVLLIGLPMAYAAYQMEGALWAIIASQFAHWPVALWFRAKQGLGSLRNDACLLPALLVGAAIGWVFVQLLAAIKG